MASLLNVIKIYQLVQKLLGGTQRQTDGQTDRQDGDLISLTFLFKESEAKKKVKTKLNQIHINKLNTLSCPESVLKGDNICSENVNKPAYIICNSDAPS
jgi:hypothetical protein